MKNWITYFCLLLSLKSVGQEPNRDLEFQVIKETLPQVLDANPNSLASYVKGGETYETILDATSYLIMIDSTADTSQIRLDLEATSDSIAKILENSKIFVLISDTLFSYIYLPFYSDYGDGWIDTFDIREKSTWQITYDDLVDVFQTNYKYRGLKSSIDLEFIELIRAQINAKPTKDVPIDLSELSSLNYTFTSVLPANHDSLRNLGLIMNAIRIYKPVFNKALDKACYLFSFQARNGPERAFVFVEKRNEKWCFLDTYGSQHVDRNDNWLGSE